MLTLLMRTGPLKFATWLEMIFLAIPRKLYRMMMHWNHVWTARKMCRCAHSVYTLIVTLGMRTQSVESTFCKLISLEIRKKTLVPMMRLA